MKRAVIVTMAILLLSATCWAQQQHATQGGQASFKGQDVTITGMMTCTFCNAPAMGNCTKECCQNCIKAGDPPLLQDAKGSLYVLLTGEHEKPLMTPERMNLLTEKVTVSGILVKRGGIQVIYVKKMAKAA